MWKKIKQWFKGEVEKNRPIPPAVIDVSREDFCQRCLQAGMSVEQMDAAVEENLGDLMGRGTKIAGKKYRIVNKR